MNVDPPEVYAGSLPDVSPWLDTKEIKASSSRSQGQKFKGEEKDLVAQCNDGLHQVAKNFFKKINNHDRAVFIAYGATVNEEYFNNPQELPIDYFYRLLIEKEGKEGNKEETSYWSPGNGVLDLINDNGFKTVFYGFLENIGDKNGNGEPPITLGLKDKANNDLTIKYHTITLHEWPFVYWLEIPQDPSQYANIGS